MPHSVTAMNIEEDTTATDQAAAASAAADDDDPEVLRANVAKVAQHALVLLVAYLAGYFGLSFVWVALVGGYLFVKDQHKQARRRRFEVRNFVVEHEKEILVHLPKWVLYPDAHRGDWINEILQQIWPYFTEYLTTFLKTSVEASVREYLKGFHFESINFGPTVSVFDCMCMFGRC